MKGDKIQKFESNKRMMPLECTCCECNIHEVWYDCLLKEHVFVCTNCKNIFSINIKIEVKKNV